MKTRNGFVSNSSSSSFIVGVAKVVDEAKFRKFMEDNQVPLNDKKQNWGIAKIQDLDRYYSIKKTERGITIRSFEASASIYSKNYTEDDSIFFVNIINDEGDTGQFSYDEDLGEIDYDIDLDYFDDEQQFLYTVFGKDGNITGLDPFTSDVSYGAARNG